MKSYPISYVDVVFQIQIECTHKKFVFIGP